MKGIGARSATTIAVLICLASVAWQMDLLRAERWRNLNIMVPFAIGLFAALAALFFFSFWRFRGGSKYCYRWVAKQDVEDDETELISTKKGALTVSLNHGDAVELPLSLQKAVYTIIFVLVGVVTINDRALNLLGSAQEQFNLGGERYCPDLEVPEKGEESKPGCELIYRAYELGYTEDLGSCAPEKEVTVSEVCKMRRQGEPFLHFAWRKSTRVIHLVSDLVSSESQTIIKEKFETQLNKLPALARRQSHSIEAAPRAAHHVWTNLSPPDGKVLTQIKSIFAPNDCLDRYSDLPHRLKRSVSDSVSPGRVIDHVLGQLLFSARYKSVVGYCREYTIHWDANQEVCQSLQKRPQEILAEYGVLREVRTVLDRYQLRKDLKELSIQIENLETAQRDPASVAKAVGNQDEEEEGGVLENEASLDRIPSPRKIVSFHCLMVDKHRSLSEYHHLETELQGHIVDISSATIPASVFDETVPVDAYRKVSRLLSPKFSYTDFQSRQSLEAGEDERSLQPIFRSRRYLMSRLEFLRDADLLLGHSWLQDSPEILEVYPYYHHLDHFVDIFRKAYRDKRGRL